MLIEPASLKPFVRVLEEAGYVEFSAPGDRHGSWEWPFFCTSKDPTRFVTLAATSIDSHGTFEVELWVGAEAADRKSIRKLVHTWRASSKDLAAGDLTKQTERAIREAGALSFADLVPATSPPIRDIRHYATGVFVAAVLTFLWSLIFWMNPLPYRALERAPDDYAAGTALLEHFPESGTYLIPGFYADSKNSDRLRKGPLAMLYLNREGEPTPMRTLPLMGFLLNFFSIALLAFLLWWAIPSLPASYIGRVLMVTGFGVVSALHSHGSDVIWWFHPAKWHLVVLLYTTVSWLIAGLILARVLGPAKRQRQTWRKRRAPATAAPTGRPADTV